MSRDSNMPAVLEAVDLQKRIADLPKGCISRKTINGKVRYYNQWYENGKTRGRIIHEEDLDAVKAGIEERRACEARLEEIREHIDDLNSPSGFRSCVIMGRPLLDMFGEVERLGRRDCFADIEDYIHSDERLVCILYGLRRSGKTTMIGQMIRSMTAEELSRTAFIDARSADEIRDIYYDIQLLAALEVRNIFIDEATAVKDFIDMGGALATLAATGLRIVLSGTDSLGFFFAKNDSLYYETKMIHMNPIPFREHARLIPKDDIDQYIRLGGTMRMGEFDLNRPDLYEYDSPFACQASLEEYTDLAIAENIQHSLERYEIDGKMYLLDELHEAKELTNVINRVIEDIDHRFIVDVVEKDFTSTDLAMAIRNNRRSKDLSGAFDIIDKHAVVEALKKRMSIVDAESAKVKVLPRHLAVIREYLKQLDLICDYEEEQLVDDRWSTARRTLITQPGMRFCHTRILLDALMKDESFSILTSSVKKRIAQGIEDTVCGRIMEEIVLFETQRSLPKNLSMRKIGFADGEIDMLVYDEDRDSCVICEIKHSTERHPAQYRHLVDADKCGAIEWRYGPIERRAVLYRGAPASADGIDYLNVEEYLKGLPDAAAALFPPAEGNTE